MLVFSGILGGPWHAAAEITCLPKARDVNTDEKQEVSFRSGANGISAYKASMLLTAEPGKYQVWIAPDSIRGAGGEFTVAP
jgi:hypothetical protein